ncbi:MAG TPA: polysaccharide biosynthesis tyrosine autokinase [Gemmatimonadales bacterium]|nr:polysaccharide biosynthesis tyrosine autokinase [Gemmatimonadales bacterium]
MSDNLPVEGGRRADEDAGMPSVPSALSPLSTSLDGYAADDESEGGANWRRYVAAVLRYKWLVLTITVLGIGAGVAGSRFLKPVYTAQATIWVQSPARGGGGQAQQGPIRPEQLLEQSGWTDLLRSYQVLDDVVRQMHLYVSFKSAGDSALFAGLDLAERFLPGTYTLTVSDDGKTYGLMTDKGVTVERGTVGDSVGRKVGFLWDPPRAQLPAGGRWQFSVANPRDVSTALAEELSASVDKSGAFITIELPGTNPSRAARTMNAIVRRYVDVAADLKGEKLRELTRILREQLDTSAAKLSDAENALQTFRVNTITLPSDQSTPVTPGLQQTQDPVFKNYFDMKIEREQLRRDRDAIQRILAAAPDSGLSVDGLVVIGSVHNSSELSSALAELTQKQADLRALRYRYTDQNPQVVKLAQDVHQLETVTIPGLANALISDIKAREATLDARIGDASHELKQIPLRSIEEARLERGVSIAEKLNTTLRQRYEEARLAEASNIPDVSVLDSAVAPRVPTRDRAKQVMFGGLVGGIGFAVLLAILLDRTDRRVRYPEQVSDDLGLSILGAIPHVKSNGKGLRGEVASHVVEALRGIRLGLVHAHGTAGPLVVTVSSPGPGDGKSFLASNLALAFADAGHRTLLIDADIRRGELHRLLGVKRRPGLTDVLGGRVDQQQVVQKTSYPALHFIGGGTRTPSGPELLGSPALAQLLVALRAEYSVIVVDSSPLSAGIDPYVLSTATGNLLLVMRNGVTDRELAGAKLDMLQRLPIRVLGAVLNDIRPNGFYRYYAYNYYVEGYEAKEEESVGAGAAGGKELPKGS